ncbi:MAG: hypothetical protein IPK75_03300 [Acidobacteria bacterium]|jgi:hypothetical protein|nr:hypothetical protein [Acidobacteriota bacterium]
MSAFLSIRNYVHFRRLFDAVHPFFWPILYWQLKAAWLALQREKRTGFLLGVSWWGGVRIVHRGDVMHTPAPDPLALTRPRFDHPVWSTSVPTCLSIEPPCDAMSPRLTGACRDQRSHCDRPGKESGTLLTPNTS